MFDWLCEFGGAEKYFVLKKGGPMGMPAASQPPAGSTKGVKKKAPVPPPTNPFGFMPPAMIDFPHRSFENLKCTDHSMGPGWMGTYVVRKMMEEGKKLGVEVYTEHQAVEIILNKKGEFTGVLADEPGGQTRVAASACIIATGGFAQSKEWMRRIRPAFLEGYPVHSFTMATNTGDGLTLAEKAGAQLDLETVKIPMFGPTHHPFTYILVRMAGQPVMIMVNARGRRFQNEGGRPGMSTIGIMEEQPLKIGWAIADDNTANIAGKDYVDTVKDDPDQVAAFKNFRKELEAEAKLDLAAKKANTLEELAALIHVDSAIFVAEIKKYNEFCAKGVDKDFGKEKASLVPIVKPPFYALFLSRFNEGAEGGIVNDDCLRVLSTKNKPIPGLYTAGDCCRGLLLTDESKGKFGEMPWAMASGYVVGKEVAGYLSK